MISTGGTVKSEMEQELLLLDLIGLRQGPVRSGVVSAILDRVGGASWKVYLLDSAFLQQAASGSPITGVQIEGAIDQMEREIVNGLRRWRAPLADFLIVLLASPVTSSRLLVRIAEECSSRSSRPPLVVAVQASEHEATLVEVAQLPLKWRCLEGESVVLDCDVWMEDACRETGDLPAFRRGTSLTVVERIVRGLGMAVRDCFLSVAAPEGQDALLTLVIPWSLVLHAEPNAAGASLPVPNSAVAIFRLPCWYEVQLEQTPEESE